MVEVGSVSGLSLPLAGEAGFDLTILGNGLILDGSALATLPQPTRNGLDILGASRVEIRDLVIRNFSDHGIRLFGTIDTGLVENVVVQDNRKSGVLVEGLSTRAIEFRNMVVFGNDDDGFTLSDTRDHRITGSNIAGNFTNGIKLAGGSFGITIDDNPAVSANFQAGILVTQGARDNTIGPGNSVDQNQRGGIQIDQTGSDRNAVSGNASISNNGFVGISIAQGPVDTVVADNLLIADNAGYGVFVGQSAQTVVENNQDIRGHETGILLVAAADTVVGAPGRGNRIRFNGTGLRAEGASPRLDVVANQVENNQAVGIDVQGTVSDSDIGRAGLGNVVQSNLQAGIRVGGSANAIRVRANSVQGSAVGIELRQNAGGVTVRDNAVSMSGEFGVRLSGSPGNVQIGPGNSITTSGDCGLAVDGAAGTLDVLDNTDISGNLRCGVLLRTASATIRLAGNRIRNHGSRMDHRFEAVRDGVGIWHGGVAGVTVGPDNEVSSNAIGLMGLSGAQLVVEDNGGANGFLNNTLAGLVFVEAVAPRIEDNRIAGNGIGIDLWKTRGTVRGNTLTGQGSFGLRQQGGDGTSTPMLLENNTIQGNGAWGAWVSLADPAVWPGDPAPNVGDLDPSGDVPARVSVSGNSFGGNTSGGIRVIEAQTTNLDDVRSRVAGNNWGADSPGFEQAWYGLVEVVSGAGVPIPNAGCQWLAPASLGSGGADNRGWCPGYTTGSPAYNEMPDNYRRWFVVPQTRVGSGGQLFHYDGNNPQRVRVNASSVTADVSFSWDGDLGNDPTVLHSPLCGGTGCVNQAPGGSYARFQAVRATVYSPPAVEFILADGSPTTLYPEFATVYVRFSDFDMNVDPNAPDAATAVVTNPANGDREVVALVETDISSGVFVGALPTAPDASATPGSGTLRAAEGDVIEVRAWDTVDPSMPSAVAQARIQNRSSSSIVFLNATGQAVDRVILSEPLRIRLSDPDRNKDPNLAETIPATAVTLRNLDLDPQDLEPVGLLETAEDSGVFRTDFPVVPAGAAVPGDGQLQARVGDSVRVRYQDPDDPEDISFAEALFVPEPTEATLRFREAETLQVMPGEIVRDQLLVIEVEDGNRNFSGIARDRIQRGPLEQHVTEADAMAAAWVLIESFDGAGQRVDWASLTLVESDLDTAVFRAVLPTSSRFGRNTGVLPNSVLYVVPGGQVRLTYEDEMDTAVPRERKTLTAQVREPLRGDVRFGDRWGNPSSQLLLRPNRIEPITVLADAPGDATRPGELDRMPGSRLRLRNVRNDDEIRPGSTTQETEPDSGRFVWRFSTMDLGTASLADQTLQGRIGHLVHVRMADADAPGDVRRWAHDTALLCRNVPSTISILDMQGNPLQRLVPGERIRIRVDDPDQNANLEQVEVVGIEVRSQRLQDIERLVAIETGPNTGRFEVELPLQPAGDAVPGDRRLRVEVRDEVTVSYRDEDIVVPDGDECVREDARERSWPVRTGDRLTSIEFVDAEGRPVDELAPGQPLRLRLHDGRANLDFARPDTVAVSLFRDDDRRGVPLPGSDWRAVLRETDIDTGVFEGEVEPPGWLAAAPRFDPELGMWVSARYRSAIDPDEVAVTSLPVVAAPLEVTITTRPRQGSIGDAVLVEVRVYNPNPFPTIASELQVEPFPGLPATDGGVHLRGRRIETPGERTWRLPIGRVRGGETVQLLWTSAVSPRAAPRQHAAAEVWAEGVRLSRRATAEFRVIEEPVFSRSTVFVDVFLDGNGDGRRGFGEPGLPQVRVVSGDGFSAWTDEDGRAHFANLRPGPNAFKLDPRSLPAGYRIVGDDRRVTDLRPGMLHTFSWGVQSATETIVIQAQETPWRSLSIEGVRETVPVTGRLDAFRLRIGDLDVPLAAPGLALASSAADSVYLDEIRQVGGLRIRPRSDGPARVERWALRLFAEGATEPLRIWAAPSALPPELRLATDTVLELLRPGRRYAFELEVETAGGRGVSARLPFGVFPEAPRRELGFAANFGTGESGLDPKTILALQEAAGLLRRYPSSRVLIEGFTDDTGPRRLNIELSLRRAETAKRYLELIEGVEPQRIQTRGVGPERFIAPNDSDENRALNRRVEISVFGVPAGAQAEQEPVIRFFGTSQGVDRRGGFAVQGEVRDGRMPFVVRYPDGATYATMVTLPPVGLQWPEGRTLFGPGFAAPLTFTAPAGTEVRGLPLPVTVGASGVTTVTLPLRDIEQLRLQLLAPGQPTRTLEARVRLAPATEAPPGYDQVDLGAFLSLTVPEAGVPLRRGRETLRGRTFPGTDLRFNGESVRVEPDGRFTATLPVTGESFALEVSAAYAELGLRSRFERSWPVEDPGVLAVGIVDLSSTWVREADYGSGTLDTAWQHEGQARFYMEGTLPGDVLLKARLRTEQRPLGEFLPELLNYDGPAEDIVDPERTYPVYADAATTVDEAPGEGPLYLLVRWQGQEIEVGTVQFDHGASMLEDRVETSYGARAHLTSRPLQTTWPTELDVWGTRPQSAWAQDRLQVTGGLIYRLRHGDVQEGSVEVRLEEDDPVTGLRRNVRELRHGVDYNIDHLSGRIWLLRPVAAAGPGREVIRDNTLTGGGRWIVVDYRYRPTDPLDAAGHGERVVQQLGGYGEVGVTYREEEAGGELERRGRTWAEIEPVTGTVVGMEFGRRWGAQSERAISPDGGLSWAVTRSVDDPPANAWGGWLRSEQGPFTVEGYGMRLEQGYAGLRYGSAATRDAMGVGVAWQVTDDVSVALRGDWIDHGFERHSEERLSAVHPAGPVRLEHEARLRQTPGRPDDRGDLGSRVVWPIDSSWTVWGEHQQQVFGSGSGGAATPDHRSGVGASYAFSATWEAFAEGYAGNRERGGRLGGGWHGRDSGASASYGIQEDVATGQMAGVAGVGGNRRLGGGFSLSGAQEVRHGERERGTASLAGLTARPIAALTLGVEGEYGRFRLGEQDLPLERRAARTLAGVQVGQHRMENRLGWQHSLGSGLDVKGRSMDSSIRSRWDRAAETLLRFRYAKDVSQPGDVLAARYQEWALGAAWRPVDHDRLAMLGMLRWARELLPLDLDPMRTELTAVIASVDAALRLGGPFEVGGKLAGKRSGVGWAGVRSDPVHTVLTAARFAWIFYEPFDLWGEYRLWRQFETGITEHGPLIEVGVRPWRYMRFAMGYNFSRFDDELRPHDRMDREGFRLRLQGLF